MIIPVKQGSLIIFSCNSQHAAALRLVHNAHKRAHAMSPTLLIATMSLVPARANLDGMGQTVTLISTNVRMECVYVILQQSSVSTRMDHQNVSAYMGQLEVNVFVSIHHNMFVVCFCLSA